MYVIVCFLMSMNALFQPWNGLFIGVGIQGGARILKNCQAGKDLSDHVVIARSRACPLKPFGLNLGQSTKKRGTDTSKESAASVVHIDSQLIIA